MIISGLGPALFHTSYLATTTMSVAQIATEFFTHLFFYPGQHLHVVMIMSGVVIAAVVGPIYLAKRAYEKRVQAESALHPTDSATARSARR